jgi:hypothetical protein
LQPLVYIRMWWPAVVKSWLRPVTTCVCKPEEFPLRLAYGRSPHAYVNQRLQMQLELVMMSGVPLETCWAFNEQWNNKFCYKVASCWLFLLSQYIIYCRYSYMKGNSNTSEFDVHVTVHRDTFLIIKPTRCTDYSNLFLERNCTCFGQFLCPSSGVFRCTQSNGICHTGLLLTAVEQDQDGPSWSCCTTVCSKPVRHIPLLCVQWKTPDDGQRNCPKHVEFHF